MAFEEISKGTRKWNSSNLPEKLTVHTELNDERSAGIFTLEAYKIMRVKKMSTSY